MSKPNTMNIAVVVFFAVLIGCSSGSQEQTTAQPSKSNVTKSEMAKPITVADIQSVTEGTGEALFNKYCGKCNKNGGNILNKDKPIGRESLASRNMDNVDKIVANMRDPGLKMKIFDESKNFRRGCKEDRRVHIKNF